MMRRSKVLGVVACALALAACSDDEVRPAPIPIQIPTPAPSISASSSTEIGAANIALLSCVGRFSGDHSKWCTGTALSGLVNGVTTSLKKDPALPAAAATAITRLDKTTGVAQQECDHIAENGLNCVNAFNDLMADWQQLTQAVGYN